MSPSPDTDFDVAVIGAGVVGLACAKHLAEAGMSTVVVEAESGFGEGISSRNSEVIHAGLYYPKGAFKTRLCVAGRRALYEYCETRHVPHRRCGKLIVAVDAEQDSRLDVLANQAARNGVEDVYQLSRAQAHALEPDVVSSSALMSAQTGIIDSHTYMQALVADVEAAGSYVVYKSRVRGIYAEDDGTYSIALDGENDRIRFRRVVIASGLRSQELAAHLLANSQFDIPRLHLVAGRYYSYRRRHSIRRLIYPLPEVGGLGVHATLDLGGQLKFGPDATWIDVENYDLDAVCPPEFVTAIQRYMPWVERQDLQPAYVGIRPKLSGPNDGFRDFNISGPQVHGLQGLVALFGIESPGLTASLAIGEYVARELGVASVDSANA